MIGRSGNVEKDIVIYTCDNGPLPVAERADRLLLYLADCSSSLGDLVSIGRRDEADWRALAWTESVKQEDLLFLTRYLASNGWIEIITQVLGGILTVRVSIDGYTKIATEPTNIQSSQAFVAMWFDPEMNEVYDQSVGPAIEDAGFVPVRVDRKEHVNRIEDEIVAEIRRSRFVVADFTHGKDGARGSVYYEAGYAHALGLPVILTCKESSFETLHFDTAHYSHTVWTEIEELRTKLLTRILAVVGEGPK